MPILAKAIALGTLSAAVFAALGCGAPGDTHGPMQDLTPEQRSQKMIDTINSNPNMTQAQKDMAIGMYRPRTDGKGPAPGKK